MRPAFRIGFESGRLFDHARGENVNLNRRLLDGARAASAEKRFRRACRRRSNTSCYSGAVDTLRLALVTFAIVGIAYVCIGSGAFSGEKSDWWGELPKQKKNIFIAAIAATILQTFL